jgi:hypothetical protein
MAAGASSFTIDDYRQDDPYEVVDGVASVRSHIVKTFHGDLEATSTVEMLSVQAPVDGQGAGYVALETIRGTLAGRSGTFAVLHQGTMVGSDYTARWPISPGSGTGELAGITGEVRIEISPDGAHTLRLDYELGG